MFLTNWSREFVSIYQLEASSLWVATRAANPSLEWAMHLLAWVGKESNVIDGSASEFWKARPISSTFHKSLTFEMGHFSTMGFVPAEPDSYTYGFWLESPWFELIPHLLACSLSLRLRLGSGDGASYHKCGGTAKIIYLYSTSPLPAMYQIPG